MTTLTERERTTIECIDSVRAEHYSCTAAEVATRLGISKAYMSEVLQVMADKGMVAWSDGVIGSLRTLVDRDGEPRVASSSCDQCDWPNAKALAGHRLAKHRPLAATSKRR